MYTHAYTQTHSYTQDCKEFFFTNRIDHFNYNAFPKGEKDTFEQRYFVCKPKYWKGPDGPIFFYTGNEVCGCLCVRVCVCVSLESMEIISKT